MPLGGVGEVSIWEGGRERQGGRENDNGPTGHRRPHAPRERRGRPGTACSRFGLSIRPFSLLSLPAPLAPLASPSPLQMGTRWRRAV